ncbi:MAG TPA: hypothetical protein VII66_11170, partial [Gemmatimonadaceae bacterium]
QLPWGVAAAALVAAVWFGSRSPHSPPRPVVRSIVPLELRDPTDAPLNEVGPSFDVSADGTEIVYVGPDPEVPDRTALWLRRLDRLDATPIPGTRDGQSPRISIDGSRIAFRTRSADKDHSDFQIVPLAGGVPLNIGRDWQLGYAWRADGSLLFRGNGRFIPFNPGHSVKLDSATFGERSVLRVDISPDGNAVLFTKHVPDHDSVMIARPDGSAAAALAEGRSARFLDDRHLCYVTVDGTLFVARLDPQRLILASTPVPVTQGIGHAGNGDPLFATGAEGTLAYIAATATGVARLVWVDRHGAESPVSGSEPAVYGAVTLSPDGGRAVVSRGAFGYTGSDIWVVDLRQGASTRLTNDGRSFQPIWDPDGRSISYLHLGPARVPDSTDQVFRRPSDGGGAVDTVLHHAPNFWEVRWTPNGKYLIDREEHAGTGRDIYYHPNDALDKAIPFAVERYQERSLRPSPDGRWLAYVSDRTGRDEVYAEAFPGGGALVPISLDGGHEPVWSHDGSEVYYRSLDGFMMAAHVSTTSGVQVAKREQLFAASGYLANPFLTMYDVAADGRFLMIKLEPRPARTDVVLVTNWLAEVKTTLGEKP